MLVYKWLEPLDQERIPGTSENSFNISNFRGKCVLQHVDLFVSNATYWVTALNGEENVSIQKNSYINVNYYSLGG